ncbi:MAG: VOC family protein [Cypionkella sp.]
MSSHGLPCWYELSSADLDATQKFYGGVLGWDWQDSGMQGMTYLLGKHGKTMIAGLYPKQDDAPQGWQIYFAVDSADQTLAKAETLGARVLQPAMDIPGTGRFAVLADPQGARFGVLQPLPMEGATAGGAFSARDIGHCNWQDLVTSDDPAAFAFYAALFGWTISRSMPMGPTMTYHILCRDGLDFGGYFASPDAAPAWKPYFGVTSAQAAKTLVTELGGKVLHGPDEVPGGMFTLQISDPTGTALGLVGGR